jgi:hypothetical protein
MGIGKDFDPSKPVSSENTPSPWKGNPEKAKEDARKGGIAKHNRSELQKSLDKLRKQQLKLYRERLETRVAKFDKLLNIFEKELLKPVQRTRNLPDGTIELVFQTMPNGDRVPVMDRMTEGKLELLLKYQKQIHEQVEGKPKMVVDGKIDLPITLIIQEEQEPEDITPDKPVIDITPENVQIEEQDDSGDRVQPDTGASA